MKPRTSTSLEPFELYLKVNRVSSCMCTETRAFANVCVLHFLQLTYRATDPLAYFPLLCTVTTLTHLDLSRNFLSSIPAEIGRLRLLQVLNLSDNRLTRLPPAIGQLTALQHLYLQFNRLNSLPPDLSRCKKLQTLLLDDNPYVLFVAYLLPIVVC